MLHRPLLARIRMVVPRGVALPADVLASRHTFLVWVLAAHAVLIAVAGVAVNGMMHGVFEALPLAVLALVGQRWHGRWGRWPVSLGLLVTSATLVHLSGGLIEMHFHFFAVVSLVALYRSWPTLLTTAGFVALHHGVVGTIAPEQVYNHPAALAQPWLWAGVHALLVLLAVAVCSMWWRYSEVAEVHAAALAREQEHGALNARRAVVLQAQVHREQATIDRLKELDDLRSTFLQAVSHELRTPLTSIVGFSAVLDRDGTRLDESQRAHLAGRLRVNAERLSSLLTDLLDLDRLTAGRGLLNRTETSLAAAIQRVLVEVEAPWHSIEATLGDEAVMAVDVAKFERIVDNLLRNAVKHTPAGSCIRVQLERNDHGALLTVSDDGPGIPAAMRDRMFEPFEQAANSRHAPSPGTGIGLSLVSKFAELHGGRAWIEDAPTGGACIRVQLPDPSAATAEQSAPCSRTAQRHRSPQTAPTQSESQLVV